MEHGKGFIISQLSYLLKDFKSQFSINGLKQRVGSGLEYFLRPNIED